MWRSPARFLGERTKVEDKAVISLWAPSETLEHTMDVYLGLLCSKVCLGLLVHSPELALNAKRAGLDAGNLTEGARSLSPFVEEPVKMFQPLVRAALETELSLAISGPQTRMWPNCWILWVWAESVVEAEVCADSEASCHSGLSSSIKENHIWQWDDLSSVKRCTCALPNLFQIWDSTSRCKHIVVWTDHYVTLS